MNHGQTTAPRRVLAGIGVATMAVALAACSSSKAKSAGSTSAHSSPASSSAAAPTTSVTDYARLLIAPSDIPVAGFTEGTPSAPPNGAGVTVSYTYSDQTRVLGDTILVFDSASAASTAAQTSVIAAKHSVTGAEVSPAPIGGGGTAVRGTSGANAVAVLIFTEGRAEVVLQFNSPAADPVPTSIIQAVSTRQDALVKAGMPG